MTFLREYFFRILLTALICAMLESVPLSGGAKDLRKLVCGLVLSLAVIVPLPDADLRMDPDSLLSLSEESEIFIQEGEALARDALADGIRRETEAYIHTKAGVRAEVTLSSDTIPVPVAVTLRGICAEEEKQQIEALLTEQLGIEKENITWIG